MTPTSFDFGAADRASHEYKRLVRAVDDAVAVLTLDVAAGACGVSKSDLRAMLDGRNGRRLSTEIAAIVAERVGPGQYRDAILDAIRAMFNLYQPEDGERYALRLEMALLGFGEHGREELAKCRREARR